MAQDQKEVAQYLQWVLQQWLPDGARTGRALADCMGLKSTAVFNLRNHAAGAGVLTIRKFADFLLVRFDEIFDRAARWKTGERIVPYPVGGNPYIAMGDPNMVHASEPRTTGGPKPGERYIELDERYQALLDEAVIELTQAGVTLDAADVAVARHAMKNESPTKADMIERLLKAARDRKAEAKGKLIGGRVDRDEDDAPPAGKPKKKAAKR